MKTPPGAGQWDRGPVVDCSGYAWPTADSMLGGLVLMSAGGLAAEGPVGTVHPATPAALLVAGVVLASAVTGIGRAGECHAYRVYRNGGPLLCSTERPCGPDFRCEEGACMEARVAGQ